MYVTQVPPHFWHYLSRRFKGGSLQTPHAGSYLLYSRARRLTGAVNPPWMENVKGATERGVLVSTPFSEANIFWVFKGWDWLFSILVVFFTRPIQKLKPPMHCLSSWVKSIHIHPTWICLLVCAIDFHQCLKMIKSSISETHCYTGWHEDVTWIFVF